MTYEETYAKQAGIIEKAIRECLELDEVADLPVGWFLAIATRDPNAMEEVAHRFFAPAGQPHYATVGLLLCNLDAMRGVGSQEWKDE